MTTRGKPYIPWAFVADSYRKVIRILEEYLHGEDHDHTATDGSGVLTNDEHDGYSQYTEISDPGGGGSNTCRLYARDNGAGKTELVAVFSSGAVQVIATQP
jgi:hypothetical protein